MFVKKEWRLKQKKLESAHLVTPEKRQVRKGKGAHHKKKNKMSIDQVCQ